MIFILNKTNSIANDFLRELRDTTLQLDRMRFRRNIERMGEIMAYEVSKKLEYKSARVTTPLGELDIPVLKSQPVLMTIMRAGLPFFQGFLNFFDKADCSFIGAYRQENAQSLTIRLEYLATTEIKGKTLILIDPMLATGRSVMDSLQVLLKHGTPQHVHFVSLVAAPEGLNYLEEKLKIPFSLWTCAVDERLNDDYYIVPGLGDAGDLSYGLKI